MRAEVRPATAEDIEALADRMRQADRDELAASHGHSPREALEKALAASTSAWVGVVDGLPVCMFGVAPASILSGRGVVWMLGAQELDSYPRTFLRRCRGCVDMMHRVYPRLENFVDDRNTTSKNWLRWLGFTLAEEAVTLRSGVQFRHFWRETSHV